VVALAEHFEVRDHAYPKIENPCVGGSIPPRATENSAVKQKRQPSPVGVFVCVLTAFVRGLFQVPALP
jgi:hypothetical protein